MTEPPFEAVVFDMDGVLIDSEPLWQEAEIDAFARVGLQLQRSDCRRTMGMRVDAVVDFWLRRRPWDERRAGRQDVIDWILDGVIERVRERGARLPGVDGALRQARRRSRALALASSSPRRVIDGTLESLELTGAFDLTVSAEGEARGKPAPDVYRTACRRLQAAPGVSLAIEDSLAGLRSARSAGMLCLMVPDTSIREDRRLREADLVLDSLRSLDDSGWERLERAARAAAASPDVGTGDP